MRQSTEPTRHNHPTGSQGVWYGGTRGNRREAEKAITFPCLCFAPHELPDWLRGVATPQPTPETIRQFPVRRSARFRGEQASYCLVVLTLRPGEVFVR